MQWSGGGKERRLNHPLPKRGKKSGCEEAVRNQSQGQLSAYAKGDLIKCHGCVSVYGGKMTIRKLVAKDAN